MDIRHRKILLEHLPAQSLELVENWMKQYPASLKITQRRNSKMGDYRPPLNTPRHRISVNGDLYPDAFLVTLVHEIAHLFVWERYKRTVRPHGVQWKNQFRLMLKECSDRKIFNGEVRGIVERFISGDISYSMFNLHFEKKIYEIHGGDGDILLAEIPPDSVFSIQNGRTFIKKEKLRTRFRCQEIRSGRYYLISSLARVKLRHDVG